MRVDRNVILRTHSDLVYVATPLCHRCGRGVNRGPALETRKIRRLSRPALGRRESRQGNEGARTALSIQDSRQPQAFEAELTAVAPASARFGGGRR